MQLFKKKNETQLPTEPVDYPSGMAVDTEKGIYLIKGKSKFKFYNDRVFRTWGMKPVEGTAAAVSKFNYAGFIGFRDGSVIRNIADAKVYLISDNKLRQVLSPDVFVRFNIDRNDIIEVGEAEVKIHKEGDPLI